MAELRRGLLPALGLLAACASPATPPAPAHAVVAGARPACAADNVLLRLPDGELAQGVMFAAPLPAGAGPAAGKVRLHGLRGSELDCVVHSDAPPAGRCTSKDGRSVDFASAPQPAALLSVAWLPELPAPDCAAHWQPAGVPWHAFTAYEVRAPDPGGRPLTSR